MDLILAGPVEYITVLVTENGGVSTFMSSAPEVKPKPGPLICIIVLKFGYLLRSQPQTLVRNTLDSAQEQHSTPIKNQSRPYQYRTRTNS